MPIERASAARHEVAEAAALEVLVDQRLANQGEATRRQGGLDHGRGGVDVEAVAAQLPVGRTGQPDDITSAALFLASDCSSYMLGAEIVVDGGRAEL
ncbi:MAG: SDR family oxidoreductase [Reyranella sp.]|uniref:SDR family oxidoreductase n=1 Tax=Reyranella sp. TaxID=1929291 RepID=UPI003D0BC526